MRAKTNNVLVGLFVLLLGAAFIAGLLWITAGGPPKDYEFYLVFSQESVSGLSVDATVNYKGVNVGRVREIGLDPADPERVRLLLVVLEGTPIKTDTVAVLEFQGLTGIANINLEGGTKDSPPLQMTPGFDYPVIPSRPSLFARLDQTTSDVIGNIIELSDRLILVLSEENRERISSTLGSIDDILEDFAEQTNRLGDIVDKFDGTLENANRASAELPALVQDFRNVAGNLDRMAMSLGAAGDSLTETSETLEVTFGRTGENLQRFTRETLPGANRMVAELQQTARNLRRMSEQLERDPSVILRGPRKPEPGPGEAIAQ